MRRKGEIREELRRGWMRIEGGGGDTRRNKEEEEEERGERKRRGGEMRDEGRRHKER